MQASNVKPISQSNLVLKPYLVDEIYEPSLSQKSDKIKAESLSIKTQEANMLSIQRTKNLKRLLEAYSDCV